MSPTSGLTKTGSRSRVPRRLTPFAGRTEVSKYMVRSTSHSTQGTGRGNEINNGGCAGEITGIRIAQIPSAHMFRREEEEEEESGSIRYGEAGFPGTEDMTRVALGK